MHHIHISTGFLFVLAIFVVGLTVAILAFIRATRKDKLEAQRPIQVAMPHSSTSHSGYAPSDSGRSYSTYRQPAPQTSVAPQGPVYAAAPVYANDPLQGFVTGMLLGEVMSHHDHTTTVIHDSPSYVDSGSYVDSSPSYDSGFSYSDSGSSSSSDSSSGGFDISW